jgi:benzodiazapine receptor
MAGLTSTRPPGLGRQIAGLAGWLVLCFAAAAIGAIASADAGAFYAQLVRPGWAPPAWLFAPVWTALYATMAISAWLVWKEYTFIAARTALSMFIVQLAANALWSWIFFAWRQGALAFAEVLVLSCLIAITIAMFWRLRTIAALLLLPYLAWVTFATLLTFSTWRLNPGLL